jgi:hypothetical protein
MQADDDPDKEWRIDKECKNRAESRRLSTRNLVTAREDRAHNNKQEARH